MNGFILGATSGVLGILVGWLVAYARVKGENLATKEDFAAILRQTEANTRAIEAARASVARQHTLDAELRQAVFVYTKALTSLLHSICWLTWDAKVRGRVDQGLARNYDSEVHRLSPDMVGQLAVISMLHPEVHRRLAPYSSQVFALDVDVASALVLTEQNLESGLADLTDCHRRANELEERFRSEVADLLAASAPPPAV
ncbi:MAG: hypothetical protein U0002_08950 [Thermoanaerobaculia bacterium]